MWIWIQKVLPVFPPAAGFLSLWVFTSGNNRNNEVLKRIVCDTCCLKKCRSLFTAVRLDGHICVKHSFAFIAAQFVRAPLTTLWIRRNEGRHNFFWGGGIHLGFMNCLYRRKNHFEIGLCRILTFSRDFLWCTNPASCLCTVCMKNFPITFIITGLKTQRVRLFITRWTSGR